MNLEEIRSNFPEWGQEIVLNASYQTDSYSGVLALLAKKGNKLFLWEIARSTAEPRERKEPSRRKKVRNRETIQENLIQREHYMRIRKLVLGEHVYTVSSASGTGVGEEANEEERIFLIYLLGKGMKLGRLERISFDKLRINCYELKETELPKLSTGKKISCEVELEAEMIPVMVNKRIRLLTQEYKNPRRVRIEAEGEPEIDFYIRGITFFDPWEESKTHFEDKRYTERFSQEEIERLRMEYMKNLPGLCPEGWLIPLVEYESREGYQAQFYSVEYLKKPIQSSSSAMLLLFRPDQKTGPMGYQNRVCPLNAVEKDYKKSMDLELFFYYKRIPEQTVACKRLL